MPTIILDNLIVNDEPAVSPPDRVTQDYLNLINLTDINYTLVWETSSYPSIKKTSQLHNGRDIFNSYYFMA
jgi:hypothetical protein